jgi:hypothetical protein
MLLPLLFLLVGLGLSAGAAFAFARTKRFLAHAQQGQGEVLALEESRSQNGTSYHPVVGFQTWNGERVEFRSATGSSSRSYRVGQSVPILYDPANPSDARIHGFMHVWLLTGILGFMGAVFTIVGGVLVAAA